MKNNVSFVKSIIPIDKYQEVEARGDRFLVHFSPSEVDGCVECVECSVPAEGFDSKEAKAMYDNWAKEQQDNSLAIAKRKKLMEIEAYDTSDAINKFTLNGKEAWLDYELRNKIYESNERLSSVGRSETTLWIGTDCYTLSISSAQHLISEVESYAKDCFNTTALHKKEVGELKTVEEVEVYDITVGYPNKLILKI